MDDVEQQLNDIKIQSEKYLESISGLELMKQVGLFMNELEKLTSRQHLPAIVMIGCLMDKIQKLSTKYDDILLGSNITKSFSIMQGYVDKNFMKKE